jgi:hypothetical protein
VEEVDAQFFAGEAEAMTAILQRLVAVQSQPGQRVS